MVVLVVEVVMVTAVTEALIKDWKERVTEAVVVVEKEEEAAAMAAADRNHVHGAHNDVSRTTRNVITQVVPCTLRNHSERMFF